MPFKSEAQRRKLVSRQPAARKNASRTRKKAEAGKAATVAAFAMARSPLDRVRRLCLALPNTWEKLSHGEPTFWVGKKMFVSFANADNHHGAGRHAIWCNSTHATQDLLITRSPTRYFSPPYVGPSGWVGIYLDGKPDWSEVANRLAHAHELASAVSRPKARKR